MSTMWLTPASEASFDPNSTPLCRLSMIAQTPFFCNAWVTLSMSCVDILSGGL